MEEKELRALMIHKICFNVMKVHTKNMLDYRKQLKKAPNGELAEIYTKYKDLK